MILRNLLRRLPIERFRNPPPRVAVVRLEGVISATMSRFGRGVVNLQTFEQSLERAFSMPDLAAVALAINSPGGSAVQSSLVAGRIRALAEENDIPVFAFVEDVAASGGYWLACAGDEIYADASSIIGSIGVISASFGFTDLISRHGVERRIYTAGEHKATLDPFLPEDPDDVERLKKSQSEIHDTFKKWVQSRRGGRLAGPEDELYSGAFWTGGKAREFGLVDAIGDLRSVMRTRYGEKVRIVRIGGRRSLLSLFRGSSGLAQEAGFADSIVESSFRAIEERTLWSRIGL